jgi:hypothetical protein
MNIGAIVPGAAITEYEPTHWMLVFWPRAAKDWVNRWVPGRFKHVSAIGYVARTQMWLFYDIQLPRTVIVAVPQDHGGELVAGRFMTNNAVLQMPVNLAGRRWGVMTPWCVGGIKHLIGLKSCALTPDGLWRDCIANGAEVLSDATPTRHELPAH